MVVVVVVVDVVAVLAHAGVCCVQMTVKVTSQFCRRRPRLTQFSASASLLKVTKLK